jgi:hypothetical protein
VDIPLRKRDLNLGGFKGFINLVVEPMDQHAPIPF